MSTKKWQGVTKGGLKILSIHGPDCVNLYSGTVDLGEGIGYESCIWDTKGRNTAGIVMTDLVPAEPEVEYMYAEADGAFVTNWYRNQDTQHNLKLGFVDGALVSAEVIK